MQIQKTKKLKALIILNNFKTEYMLKNKYFKKWSHTNNIKIRIKSEETKDNFHKIVQEKNYEFINKNKEENKVETSNYKISNESYENFNKEIEYKKPFNMAPQLKINNDNENFFQNVSEKYSNSSLIKENKSKKEDKTLETEIFSIDKVNREVHQSEYEINNSIKKSKRVQLG